MFSTIINTTATDSTTATYLSTSSTSDESYSVTRDIPRSQCTISPSVVLIGIFDKRNGSIVNIASGFIADSTRGHIVTASHILGLQPDKHPFIIATNIGNEVVISYQYYARLVSVYSATCCLRLTHVLDSAININRHRIIYNNHNPKRSRSITPLSSLEIRSLYVGQPATQMHLHRLFELCITETLEIGHKIISIGYNGKCKGPFCLSYGHCYMPVASKGEAVAPHHITMRPKCTNQEGELLGGPCICADGRVIGILSNVEEKGMSFKVTSAPVIEIALKIARRECDKM